MLEQALQFATSHQEEHLNELIDLLQIPSISTLPEHKDDVQRAANWLVRHMENIGVQEVRVMPTAGHPAVYGQWIADEERPTILVYGHYDVQPVDPVEEWQSDPFQPQIREDNLYARGSSDDKGQLFTHLKAAEAYLKTAGKLPVNVKYLFEGEEEMGSDNLPPFIEEHQDLLAADVAVISDGGIVSPEVPAITCSLRGLTYMEVEVTGPAHDLHSGAFGGAVHNPLEALAGIISQLKDEQGRITIPGFYDRVLPLTEEEREEMRRIPFDEGQFRRETGVPKTWGEEGYSVLEQISARPTLEINGFIGGFTGEGSKTVLPARAMAKISMRLVPEQDSKEVARLFQEYVESISPDTVQVSVRTLATADAALIDRSGSEMQAAFLAYEKGFGARPLFTREGGTIPVVSLLSRVLGMSTLMLNFGLPDDNWHAPNEKLYLPNFYRGIKTLIYFLDALSVG